MRDENIPIDGWAFVLRKCLSGKPLRVTETVPDNLLNEYHNLKKLLEQYFQLTEIGQRQRLKKISPKTNQTFLDFVTEVKLTLENWTKSDNVHAFDDLKELLIKDKISAVPHRISTFLVEQSTTTLEHVILKGTAFCDANKDIFVSGLTAELNIRASAMFQEKQKYGKTKSEKVGFMSSKHKALWRGNFVECKYCKVNQRENEMCESNPDYKKIADKHLKAVSTRNTMYTPRRKC